MQNKKENSEDGRSPSCHVTFNFNGNTQFYNFIQPGNYQVDWKDGKSPKDLQSFSGKSEMFSNSGAKTAAMGQERADEGPFTFPITIQNQSPNKNPEKGRTQSPIKGDSAGGMMSESSFLTPESRPICNTPMTWSVQRW